VIAVDTNVIAHLLVPGQLTAAAQALYQADPEWVAPALWRSELRNVLLGCLRSGRLSDENALALQAEAEDLLADREYEIDSASVLRLAAQSGCSAYDCEFVALAQALSVKLVTLDRQLLAAFPEVATALSPPVVSPCADAPQRVDLGKRKRGARRRPAVSSCVSREATDPFQQPGAP
jgi:predicted nucleic acid-binding protein